MIHVLRRVFYGMRAIDGTERNESFRILCCSFCSHFTYVAFPFVWHIFWILSCTVRFLSVFFFSFFWCSLSLLAYLHGQIVQPTITDKPTSPTETETETDTANQFGNSSNRTTEISYYRIWKCAPFAEHTAVSTPIRPISVCVFW